MCGGGQTVADCNCIYLLSSLIYVTFEFQRREVWCTTDASTALCICLAAMSGAQFCMLNTTSRSIRYDSTCRD